MVNLQFYKPIEFFSALTFAHATPLDLYILIIDRWSC